MPSWMPSYPLEDAILPYRAYNRPRMRWVLVSWMAGSLAAGAVRDHERPLGSGRRAGRYAVSPKGLISFRGSTLEILPGLQMEWKVLE